MITSHVSATYIMEGTYPGKKEGRVGATDMDAGISIEVYREKEEPLKVT